MPPLTPDEEALAIRYLEGEVTDEERSRVEERIFRDDEYFDQLEALRDEIVNDYVLGRLPSERRRHVAAWIDRSPTVRREVAFTSALSSALTSGRGGFGVAWPFSRIGAAIGYSSARRLGYVVGIAAAIVLVAVAGVVLWRQTASLSRQLADARASENRLRTREEVLTAELERARADARALQEKIRNSEAAGSTNTPASANPPAQRVPVVEFVLSEARLQRSDNVTTAAPRVFTVPAGADVRLTVDLPPEVRVASAHVELQTADGHVRWSQTTRAGGSGSSQRQLVVRLPSTVLDNDSYFLVVGPPDRPLVTYDFSVVRR